MPSLILLATLLASAVLADWTVTISPKSDPNKCFTSTGVGKPVKILPCSGSEEQKWTTWEGCGGKIENTFADQFVGFNQCLDWKDGRGETLQLWNCVEGNSNQQWVVRYA